MKHLLSALVALATALALPSLTRAVDVTLPPGSEETLLRLVAERDPAQPAP